MPDLSNNFQSTVEEIFRNGYESLKKSKNLYKEATDKLITELSLNNWKVPAIGISIKSFSSSFISKGRLDAEYYQPKYDDLLAQINGFEMDILDNLVNVKKSIEPGSEAYLSEGVPFLRVADLSKYGLSAPAIFLDKDRFNIADMTPRKDTILLSKDGSVEIAYKVEKRFKSDYIKCHSPFISKR